MAARMTDEARVKSSITRVTTLLASAGKRPLFTDQNCERDARMRDIHRGMVMALAGYFLVISDLRVERFDYVDRLPEDYGQVDRTGLYSFWTVSRAINLWSTSKVLASLSPDDKRAIGAFLTELRLFRARYTILLRANTIFGQILDFDAVNEILKRAGNPFNKCLQEPVAYELMWSIAPGVQHDAPAGYMIRFWYRRDRDGKTDLADQFVSSMIALLR
jgi:hypothetical protein